MKELTRLLLVITNCGIEVDVTCTSCDDDGAEVVNPINEDIGVVETINYSEPE